MFGFFRLYLAVIVALYHYFALPAVGLWAVVSFFVLSGFLMTTIMNESYGYTLKGVRKYAINRWLRLFPSYYFVALFSLIVFFCLPSEENTRFVPDDLTETIANVTMIFPSFYPGEYIPRLVHPTWALTLEIIFYALIALGISKNKSATVTWFVLSIGYLIYTSSVSGRISGLGYGNVLQASLPFSLGALIYHYKQYFYELMNKIHLNNLSVLAVLFAVNQAVVLIGYNFIGPDAWKIELVGAYMNIGLSCMIIIVLFYNEADPVIRRFDNVLGQYSYPIYLCHPIGAILAVRLFDIPKASSSSLLFLAIAGGICLFLSVVCVYGIDNNIEKMRRRIKKKVTTS